MSAPAPAVSVVIPHYQDQAGLDAVLDGLARQSLPEPVEVIVADDGSARAPRLPEGVRLVRQEDRGFRAAAARSLGASCATGEVLAFLDGDTVPEPGYLAAVLDALRRHPHAVVVGTRTHLDDADVEPGRPPADLGEPAWLRDAWAATDHLRRHDDANFRYVISAVLSCRRELFERIGGFDGTMVGYGGEDWEFGWQAVLAGADLLHVPDARAVHRGADWGGRSAADRAAAAAQKNAETLRLASRITHPIARPQGLVHAVPDIQVSWDLGRPGHRPGAGAVALAVGDLLAAGDVHVRLAGLEPSGTPGDAQAELAAMLAADPRVVTRHRGPEVASAEAPPARVRPRFHVELLEACRVPPGDLAAVCAQVAAVGGCGEVTGGDGRTIARVVPERARARGERDVHRLTRPWGPIDEEPRLEDVVRDAAAT